MTKSKSFWALVTLAIFAAGLWAFINLYNAKETVSGTSTAQEQVEDDIYMSLQFSTAIVSAQNLTLTGTAPRGSRVVLSLGAQPLPNEIATLIVNEAGQWSFVSQLSAVQARGADMSVSLHAVLSNNTIVRSTDTLLISAAALATRASAIATEPGGPSRVLQSPFGAFPEIGGLKLESIDYDNSGGVIFTGHSDQQGVVAVYANQALIGETGVGENGRWTLIAGSTLPVGAYDITIALLDSETRLLAKLDIPFERFSLSAQKAPEQAGAVSIVKSQDLWHYTRALKGGGFQQTVIYAPTSAQPTAPETGSESDSGPQP